MRISKSKITENSTLIKSVATKHHVIWSYVQQHRVSPCQNHVTRRQTLRLLHSYLQYIWSYTQIQDIFANNTPTSAHYYNEIRLIIAAISRQVCATKQPLTICSAAQNIVTNGILKQITPYSLAGLGHFSCRSSFNSISRQH